VSATVESYPRTVRELEQRFATEEACRLYFAELRWPQGFRCPACGEMRSWVTKRGLWVCAACQKQTSVTAGTIFQDTRKELRTWFRVVWWVCGQKNGVSALAVQRLLGFGSYETAWTWLHKLRRAMVRPGRDRLSGQVEADETYIGGVRPGKRGRGAAGKTMVVIVAQKDGRSIGRIRLGRVANGSAAEVEAFIRSAVEPGTEIETDGNQAYNGLPALGYPRRITLMKAAAGDNDRMLPRVHQVASLLKRWLLGTHQGAVDAQHLDYYLDEFTFRFNRRTSRSRGMLFYRLLQQAAQVDPAPYSALVGGRARPDHNI
jgi:transposase-like protein/ribosomal protein L37AE/L43A